MSSSRVSFFWLVLEGALPSLRLKYSLEIIWILSSQKKKKKKSTHTSELKSELNSALFKCASTLCLLCSSTSTPPTPPGRKKDNMNLFVLKSKMSYAIRVLPWYLYWLLRIMIALKHECLLKLLNSHYSTIQRIWCKHYFCILQISFAKILPWAFLPFLFFF